MIWDPHRQEPDGQSAMVSHITAEIEAAGGVDIMADPSHMDQLAHAVETFLKDNNASAVESRYLVFLASRALASLGEERAARRVLLFGSGLVRPAEWEISTGQEMLVLDLRQVTLRGDACVELVFFNALSVVLESIADLWDPTAGGGVLGLKNVCRVAADLLGHDGKKQVEAVATDIRIHAGRKLEQVGTQRNWTDVPRVINLDI